MPVVTHLLSDCNLLLQKAIHNLYKRRPLTFNGNVLQLEAVPRMKLFRHCEESDFLENGNECSDCPPCPQS